MNNSNAINDSQKASTKKEDDWVLFSSDDESVDEPRKPAAMKDAKPAAKATSRSLGNNENRKANAKSKIGGKSEKGVPRKAGKSIKKTIAGGFKFGADAGHMNAGRQRAKSPRGKPMILSRRLSRRIMRGSPLRSPITAMKIDFGHSAKKKAKKTKSKAAKEGGRPPRAS